MPLALDYTEKSHPVDLRFDEETIWITMKDGRKLGLPLTWYPWLENASPDDRNNYQLSAFSINWDCLNNGIDMVAMLTGTYTGKLG